jgi:hypothetical protein
MACSGTSGSLGRAGVDVWRSRESREADWMREADERRRLAGKQASKQLSKVRLPPAHATKASQYTALYH